MSGEGPLSGLTVLDLGQIYNGPYATLLLALSGAFVIKVEPRTGEHLRERGRVKGAGAPFVMLNSNKLGVTLNLKAERGLHLLRKMAAKADVLVENFRPGVMDRLGIGSKALRQLNPRLIYASGSGYGTSGPYKDYPAMDITVQAMSGVMSTTGFPDHDPVKAGPAICDFLAGIHLHSAIMTALYQRERSGLGSTVEVAMLDSTYPALMSSLGLLFGSGGDVPLRTGNRHNGLAEAPYNAYETWDGHVALICVSDAHWSALTQAMGCPELGTDPRYATRYARVARMDEVDALVSQWIKNFSRDEVADLLREHGVPCAPVRGLDEVATDRHLFDRGMLQHLEGTELGTMTVPHSPLHTGGDREPLRPAPRLGEHNHQVYCDWLGLDQDELDALLAAEVV